MSIPHHALEGPGREPFWYLLNQVVDELGHELQSGSDNVCAPLQAIIHLTDEKMLLHITGSGAAKTEIQ
jgi:hypothetical protein